MSEYFFKTHLNYLRKNGVDEYENIREYAPSGAVSFLTIHQAKGLEFPIVIIGSLEATPDETEEKKKSFEPNNKIGSFDFWRLYYTGFSRAENLLILTAIETKTKNREVPSSPFKKLYESLPDASVREIGYQDMKIEEVKPLDIKRRYSFTGDLIRYLHCPFKYNMNYNFRFEKVVTPDNFYGILLHETLEYINKSLMENIILEKEKIKEIYFKNYDLLSKKESIRLKESVLEEGLRQILNYFNSSLLSEKILEIEKELYISTVDYIVEGRLDMIIENEKGLKVVDFKTGKRDEKEIEKYREQIVLYCYLLSKNSDKMVSGGEIYFIENGEREFIPYKNGDEIDILKRFEEMNRAIIGKQLNKKNRDIVGCAECEFKNYCFSINMV